MKIDKKEIPFLMKSIEKGLLNAGYIFMDSELKDITGAIVKEIVKNKKKFEKDK